MNLNWTPATAKLNLMPHTLREPRMLTKAEQELLRQSKREIMRAVSLEVDLNESTSLLSPHHSELSKGAP